MRAGPRKSLNINDLHKKETQKKALPIREGLITIFTPLRVRLQPPPYQEHSRHGHQC